MKFFISIILCGWILLPLTAQPRGERPRGESGPPQENPRAKEMAEKIQVERIAFFSEKIGLTTDEAQLFWPIYNEMDKKKTELFDKKAQIIRQFMEDSDKLKGKTAEDMLNNLVSIQQQESELPNLYYKQFRNIMSAEKVMKMYVAEIEFRNYLLSKMRNRREPNRNQD